MKTPLLRRGRAPLVRAHLLAFAAFGFSTWAQASCPAPADAGACPVRMGGQVVLDRCFGSVPGFPGRTPVGDAACNAVKGIHTVASELGVNPDAMRREAERNARDLVKVALAGAVDAEAVRDIQRAAGVGKEISDTINATLRDRECGSKAALDTIKRRFDEAGRFVQEAAQVSGLAVDAVGKLRPVVDESARILAELQKLATLAQAKGPKAKEEFDRLQQAIQLLQREVESLTQGEFQAAMQAGTSMATSVVPFAAACAGCATAISSAVAALGSGATASTAGAAICPETGASCVVAAAALPAGAAVGSLSSALGSEACKLVQADAAKLPQHYEQITRFVEAMVRLANALPKASTQAAASGQALINLAQQLGAEGQGSVEAIRRSLNAMLPALNAAGDQLEERVAPRVSRLANDFLRTLSGDTQTLARCYDKLNEAVALMSNDLIEAIALLNEALPLAVDANKVALNLKAQGEDAVATASRAAEKEWRRLHDDQVELHVRLFGVKPGVVDPAKTGAHLVGLATDPAKVGKIAEDATRLAQRQVKALTVALDEGKKAFLDQDKLTIQAKQKYAEAKDKSRRAVLEMAKAKARAQAQLAQKKIGIVPVVQAAPPWPTQQRVKLAQLAPR